MSNQNNKNFIKTEKEILIDKFDIWNSLKKNVNKKELEISKKFKYPKVGEVWMCHLGYNIGYEQNGIGENFLRPCLVVKKFNNQMFLVVPLSTKQKDFDFYFNFTDINNEKVSVILAQIKLVSIKRFERKMYELDNLVLKNIKSKLAKFFEG